MLLIKRHFDFSMASLLFLSGLSISLIGSRNFPNGLISLKELTGYFICVAFGFLLTFLLWKRNYVYRVCWLDGLVAIYLVGIPLIQLFLNNNVHVYSVISNLLHFFIYLSLTFFSRRISHQKILTSLITALILVVAINLFVSYLQYFGVLRANHHLSLISGFFFNPGPFAIYMASLLSALCIIIISPIPPRKSNIFGGVSLLLLGAFVLQELDSRSAWLGLLGGLFVAFICFMRNSGLLLIHRKQNVLIAILVIIIGLCTLLFMYHLRIDSANGRLVIWLSTANMILDNPITGVGINQFPEHSPYYQGKIMSMNIFDESYKNLAGEVEYAFNDWLHITAERGVFTGGLFTLIIFHVFKRLYKSLKQNGHFSVTFWLTISVSVALLVILIGGISAYPLQILPISIWFWMLIAIGSSITSQKWYNFPKHLISIGIASMSVWTLFMGIGRGEAYLNWSGKINENASESFYYKYKSRLQGNAKFYNEGGHYFRVNDRLPEACFYFREAIKYTFNKEYYYDLGQSYEAMGMYEEALQTYEIVERAIPHLIRPNYLIAKLNLQQRDTNLFVQRATKILAMKPKVNGTQVELMKKEIRFLLTNL